MTDTRMDSGRRGGKETLKRKGREHYARIGKLGGKSWKRRKAEPSIPSAWAL